MLQQEIIELFYAVIIGHFLTLNLHIVHYCCLYTHFNSVISLNSEMRFNAKPFSKSQGKKGVSWHTPLWHDGNGDIYGNLCVKNGSF